MPSEFVKEVADVFAKDGPLSKVTANYTPRPSQIEFATSVAEALEQGKSLVAEAGTGTGKTFAYLVPALLKDQKVLISTAAPTISASSASSMPCKRIPTSLNLVKKWFIFIASKSLRDSL